MMPPSFSIIIPTCNRHESLLACLEGISALAYPRDRLQVVIVDDGSQIPVHLHGHPVSHGLPLIVLRQLNAGPSAARNAGAQQAWGEVLAFLDDDCIPTPHWLQEMALAYERVPGGVYGGRILNGLADNPYSTASQLIVDEAYEYFFRRQSEFRFFATNNLAVARSRFHEIGGFDPSFRTAEDRDFCDRWIRKGHPLVYVARAMVHHYHHLTWRTFCRQHFGYGRGAHQYHRARSQRGGRFSWPDIRFYSRLLRRAVVSPISRRSLHMAWVMGLWQTANLAGFLWEMCQRKPSFVRLTDTHSGSTTHDSDAGNKKISRHRNV